ncbi:unnamed protein product [Diplocarpon coronariae]
MSEEPRRSVRATKGQHPKMEDLDQTPEPKKKAAKRSKKAQKEEEEEEPEDGAEIIRCVCGAVETGAHDTEPWIACDDCDAWQHNVCVGIPIHKEDIPEHYQCEQCNPAAHKELLEGLKRGIHLWEKRRKAYQNSLKEAAVQGDPRKKGKKKGKRASEPKNETNGKSSAPATPVPEKTKKDATALRAGSAKRKVRDESQDKDSIKEPKAKVLKVSVAHVSPRQDSPPSELPTKISEIMDKVKAGGAKMFLKNLSVTVQTAIRDGVYVLAPNDTAESKAERLAIQVADALGEVHREGDPFSRQARMIGANLKTNQELTNNLLVRKLLPLNLAMMSSDDMLSKELKREVDELKARNDKQAIMVTDDGPRVRRTHKGEEIIESDDFAMSSDVTMPTSRRRSMLDPNASMVTRSRENSPGDQVELPQEIDSYRSQDDIRGNAAPQLAIQTKTPPARKSSKADFDIQKVFSSVQAQSPTTTQHVRRESTNTAPPANGPGFDPEIDKMLQDDDGESDAYSPVEFPADPEVIWQGCVTMESVARFPATAKYVAGKHHGSLEEWAKYLTKDLRIAGRIDPDKANEYLCGMRYSPPTDVVVVEIIPSGEAASNSFQDLYNYFQSRRRYGVLTNKGLGNIRDTYLVPVPPNPGNLPDFITNLEAHQVPEERNEPILLVTLVIRNECHPVPEQSHGSASGDVTQSPSLMGHPQRQMSISGTGPSMSPINPQSSLSTPPMPQQSFQPPLPIPADDAYLAQQADEQLRRDQAEGEKVAIDILGRYSSSPTVAFLMPQAFQMRPVEWQLIRGILEEDENSRVDLQHLSQVLELRMQTIPPPPLQ